MVPDRKREVINVCLDHFIEKGLSETSTRSLSSALKLQNAGLYYYFESKDDAVIQCAEEALTRLEHALIPPALKDIQEPELMMEQLQLHIEEMAPTMRFFVSVCTSDRYRENVRPLLKGLANRIDLYVKQVAETIECNPEEVALYVYIAISAATNYMVFSEISLVAPQMLFFKNSIEGLKITNESNEHQLSL